ncbi:MAG: hypothetical protein OER97_08805 [Gammaproteobacteria bacterium]|nr:hypothetical protein [Gammaproteobacteria bacterium]
MNCISRKRLRGAPPNHVHLLAHRALILGAACLAACGVPVAESQASDDDTEYTLNYLVTPVPGEQLIDVVIELEQGRYLLREMRFDADGVADIRGDGDLEISDNRVRWHPPKGGGKLSWQVKLGNKRNGDGYDSWLNRSWGLFRAEDIIPRAATRTLKGATADTRLVFDLPRRWSVVTEYATADGRLHVAKEGRRFAQPSGWIVMGELGVRRDNIAGVRVAIAGPENQQIRRLDMLALLNWTLPELARILPELPPRLTVVSAGEPMWRGGLSAPQSIYIHADRPLISENGTSALIHETMHVALGMRAERGYDWIVEGLAEYYSLELLRRSGTLTPRRHATALERMANWSKTARTLCATSSSGATTALAVLKMRDLDAEIKAATSGEASLDDVLGAMVDSDDAVNLALLQLAASNIIGQKSDTLHIGKLPGCRKLSLADNP